jgi:DNA-binding response OmpR family regulator
MPETNKRGIDEMRVLLIDDEKELVTTLSERLDLRGIDNDWATSGEDGLEHLEKGAYDWVVVDLKMPGLGGFGTIRTIKSRWPETRIILLTGHNSSDSQDEAKGLGADHYMLKPFDIDNLLALMQGQG